LRCLAWGVRYFCVVYRRRSCRHVDFRDSFVAAPEMATVDQPIRRSDDLVRRRLRRNLSTDSFGTAMVCLLVIPISKHDGRSTPVSEPTGLGRFCGVYVLHSFAAVLVSWLDSGSGDFA